MSRTSNLKRIYAELPTIQCRGECWAFCRPIRELASDLEWDGMISAAGGRIPESQHPDLCAFLRNGRCSIYQARPFACWAFGIVESMVCPYGCKPSPRYITTLEMHAYLYRIGTGCSHEAAMRFIRSAPIEWIDSSEATPAYMLSGWTATERQALLKLYREGRTKHIPGPALRAIELIQDDPECD